MKKFSMLFCMIAMLSVVADFLADLLAIQLFTVGPFSFTGGEFVFPVVYIVNDIFSEVYGYNTTKKVIWYGLAVNVYALSMITFVAYLAGEGTPMYQYIIGDYGMASAIIVAFAGFVAYAVASFVNAYVMSKMKAKDGENRFELRAVVSTMLGEFGDSAVFGIIACTFGLWTWDVFIPTVLTITAIKTLVEIICLPVTRKVVKKVKEVEHLSVREDETTNYNPFSLAEKR